MSNNCNNTVQEGQNARKLLVSSEWDVFDGSHRSTAITSYELTISPTWVRFVFEIKVYNVWLSVPSNSINIMDLQETRNGGDKSRAGTKIEKS